MVGKTISHYRILDKIGGGGMGVVYKAEDTHLDRFVAVKFLPPEKVANPDRKRRFVQEAKKASALNHPNIVTVHDIDNQDSVDFIVMEYIDGKPLDEAIPRKGMRLNEALKYSVQLADALAKAHGAGIIHRDLKPANVMVSEDGLVKVLDFGLAKLIELPADSTVTLETAPDTIVGTPAYMSPEQIERRKLDTRSDIFSFGAVLYEMLTGRRAFQGPSAVAIMSAILREEPGPAGRELPSELQALVARCLSKDPKDRFQKTTELKKALERLQQPAHEPIEALPSIAVLPFLNMNRDEEDEFFADGLTEELINALTQLRGLRVVSRTSVFRFKGATEDICEVGRQLREKTALEGSVRRSGNRLRVTAQLINVADGYHLWSQRYDRELKDIFDVQDELTQAIVDQLKIKLVGAQKAPLVKRSTGDLEAYSLYLKGRFHLSQVTREGLRRSLEYFHAAASKDPNYAQAYAGLALSLGSFPIMGWGPPREFGPRAKAEALRALQIDDSVAEAHLALGLVRRYFEWDWCGAETELRRAIELNPGDAVSRALYAHFLGTWGRIGDATLEVRRALEIDPVSLEANVRIAMILYYGREYEQAIDRCHKTLELYPEHTLLYMTAGLAHTGKAQHAQALTCFEQGEGLGGGALLEGLVGHACAALGQRERALEIVDELKERRSRGYFPPVSIAFVYLGLDNKDQAFKWLDTAWEERDTQLIFLNAFSLVDPLRSNSRFQNLLTNIGLRESERP